MGVESDKKEKLIQYLGHTNVEEILADPKTTYLPEISMHASGGGIVIMNSVLVPNYRSTDPGNNKVLKVFATTSNEPTLKGYRVMSLYQATPFYYTADGATATWSEAKGIGSTLEAATLLLLSQGSQLTGIQPNSVIAERTFDENGFELPGRIANAADNDEVKQIQNQRAAWLRIFGEGGLAGFNRCKDDGRFIERSIHVKNPIPNLTAASQLHLERTDRNKLFDNVVVISESDLTSQDRFARLIGIQFP